MIRWMSCPGWRRSPRSERSWSPRPSSGPGSPSSEPGSPPTTPGSPPPGRGAEGRLHVHGRPVPGHRADGRPGLHGRVLLRERHPHLRGGPHREGPRRRPGQPPRAGGGGHRRFRPHPQTTCSGTSGPGSRPASRSAPSWSKRDSNAPPSTSATSGSRSPPTSWSATASMWPNASVTSAPSTHTLATRPAAEEPHERRYRPHRAGYQGDSVRHGEDPNRDGLLATPARVAAMYQELFSGLDEDPTQHLKVSFAAEHDEMVMVRDIPFASLCEHHMVPFMGGPTSPTFPVRTAGSPACPSSPGWWTATPAGCRSRSG